MHDDNQLPVLNAVARRGNASIISSTRAGYAVLDQLEAMRRDCAAPIDSGPTTAPSIGPGLPAGGVIHLCAESDVSVGPDDPTLEIAPLADLAALACSGLEAAPDIDTGIPDSTPIVSAALQRRIDATIERHLHALRSELEATLRDELGRRSTAPLPET